MIHLEMISANTDAMFKLKVERFIAEHRVLLHSVKFQRNIYYSLSGSTVANGGKKKCVEEGGTLKASYLAFLLWDDGGPADENGRYSVPAAKESRKTGR